MKSVGFSRTVEDFFRGIGLIVGSSIAIVVLFFASAFFVSGFYLFYVSGRIMMIPIGILISLAILAVPTAIILVGKKLRTTR